jgi:hypothetical protein
MCTPNAHARVDGTLSHVTTRIQHAVNACLSHLIVASPSDAATATPLGELMLIEMRHSSTLQWRIDIRLESPGTLLPSWPAFCATACRIELLQPPVQASDCKTCSEAMQPTAL